MRMKMIASLFAAGAFLGAGQAQAAACGVGMTIGTWTTSCTDADGDTIYTPGTTNIDSSYLVSIGETAGGLNSVTITAPTLTPGVAGEFVPGSYVLNYTASKAAGSDERFTSAKLDSTVGSQATNPATVVVNKLVPNVNPSVNLTSNDGVPAGFVFFDPTTLLDVTDNITVGTGGNLSDFTNTYGDVHLPEPGSMLLLGIGLMGLAYNGKKKLFV
ncbi:MAG: PEP-CTERM sorting domain-containing protein [Desulfobacteraceae bacterium]|nr:PEP-CTERM sorting domain-containing protein [Desulfobacteraceae bacterium]